MKRIIKHLQKKIHASIIILVFLFLVAALTPSIAFGIKAENSLEPISVNAENLVEQGKVLYEAEKFNDAVNILQQAATAFAKSGDKIGQAMTLSNLSLAYQQLGLTKEAENAIAQSLNLLQSKIHSPEVFAQALDVQGRLLYSQGQTEKAIDIWQQAADIYKKINETNKLTRNRINSAQALQALGLYRQSENILDELRQSLTTLKDTSLKANLLRSLGDVLRLVGNLSQSQQVLEQSLKVVATSSKQNQSEVLASLGKTARAQQNPQAALNYFQKAASLPLTVNTRIDLLLNKFSLLLETQQFQKATNLIPEIQAEIGNLHNSRVAVYARINLAQNLVKLKSHTKQSPSSLDIAKILAEGENIAHNLQDLRAESYAVGTLGWLYEQAEQLPDAFKLTEKALLLAQNINAPDIIYQWQWQMGRLLKAKGDIQARAYYSSAVKTLQSLRSDLVAINPDVQFSFRESVEPVYREYVELLLQSPLTPPLSSGVAWVGGINQDNLKEARLIIESLQLAELDNFFRSACLTAKVNIDVAVDKEDSTAGVIYPIILPDRLEVILKLPGQNNLRQYTTRIPRQEVENTIKQLREDIQEFKVGADKQTQFQKIYEWLLRQAQTDLQNSKVETLVFVLDGELRNIPMAALYDGKQYLIEKYNIAVSPGLQLFDIKRLQRGQLRALTAGLSEARFNYSKLNYVESELQQIKSEVSSQVLLNKQFTSLAFQNQINDNTFPIVHLATHGQFSSNPDKTFILAYDRPIKVNELNQLLQTRDINQPGLIELLVLSACQTATGDDRAALGLAGVAVRAGARSTLASLWNINDASTATLMSQFYSYLTQPSISKAQALRSAQLELLKQEQYNMPYYWAPYVLVGNWL
jgi:CHAT domain-containing protein